MRSANTTDCNSLGRLSDMSYKDAYYYDYTIVEDFSDLDPNSIADEALEEVEDTLTLLEKYVDEIDSVSLDKKKLNRLLKMLYIESQEIE